ncbi:MAG: polysaccharide biosynthesis/export family protein, partial [Cyanobacteria bacterium J06597_16]
MKLTLQKMMSIGAWALLAIAGGDLFSLRLLGPQPATAEVLPGLSVDAAPATVAAGVRLDDAYTLGPGDSLIITIFNVPEYSGPQQVLADGFLNMPVVGPVDVNG